MVLDTFGNSILTSLRTVLSSDNRYTGSYDQSTSSTVKDGLFTSSTEYRDAQWRDTGIRLAEGDEEDENDEGKSEVSSSAKRKKGKKERIAERRAREKSAISP